MAFQTTLQTMALFFILLCVGFAAGKLHVIRKEFMGPFAQLITKIFLPVMIFYFTVTTVSLDMLVANLVLIPIAIAVYAVLALVSLAIAKLLRLPHDKDRVFQFAFIFGNTGFVGFPLLPAVFPGIGMVFMCLFNVVDQLIFWTYGIWLSTARERETAKFNAKVLLSPNIVAIVLALIFVVAGIPLPGIIDTALATLSKGTSPLCMLYLGATICFTPIGAILKRPDLYIEVIVKMIALPIGAGLLAGFLGASPEVAGCIALFIALPVMTVVPMIATQNGNEGAYATGLAVVTFVACVITIPLVAFVVL